MDDGDGDGDEDEFEEAAEGEEDDDEEERKENGSTFIRPEVVDEVAVGDGVEAALLLAAAGDEGGGVTEEDPPADRGLDEDDVDAIGGDVGGDDDELLPLLRNGDAIDALASVVSLALE